MYADLHCDTFYKCFTEKLSFSDSGLHINAQNSKAVRPYIQTFAHYIPENVTDKFDYFQRMLEHSLKIIHNTPELLLFTHSSDIEKAEAENKILAVLSVEGGDFFEKDIIQRAELLEKNFIRFISLCYNNGNALCSGAFSKNDYGFTKQGYKAAYSLCEHNIVMDVSHLSAKSAKDAVDNGFPCIATHSNCKSVLNHPRNLDDDVITGLIESKSLIGLNFYKPFVGKSIKRHIDYITSLGGESNIAFGCDFDGCDEFSDNVSSLSDIPAMSDVLYPHASLWYDNVKNYLKNI